MDSDKRETMSVTIAIFSDSVVGNTAEYSCLQFHKIHYFWPGCDRILAVLYMSVDEFFYTRSCAWLCSEL